MDDHQRILAVVRFFFFFSLCDILHGHSFSFPRHALGTYRQFARRIKAIPPLGEQDINRAQHGRFRVIYGASIAFPRLKDNWRDVTALQTCSWPQKSSTTSRMPLGMSSTDCLQGKKRPLPWRNVKSTGTLQFVVIKITIFCRWRPSYRH